jgi:ectoine hydroxylase-related dioxygenase (phytanoyl-CoA dioxygenase family)
MISRFNEPLKSNHFALEMRPERLGWLEPSSASAPISGLRDRFFERGYLWLKNFLPRQDVLEFRRHFFAQFLEAGLLKPGSDPLEGVYAGGGEDAALVSKRLMELVRSAAYESFCLHPRLWRFLDAFLGGPAYLHKRKLIRFTKPRDPAATGAHYDLVYLRGGTDRFCTVWMPIGDTSVEMGGLTYLEGSSEKGHTLEADFRERNLELLPDQRLNAFNKNMSQEGWISKDLPGMANRFDSRWLIADYEAGDIVLHGAYTIHAATTNEDQQGRLRLSTDIRYQNVRDEIDARWANHWTLEDML